IKNLFERNISRPINGVVKADQLDDASVWQELEEFVITRELDQHFRKFISWYLEAVDQGKNSDPAGKMGIWISGFFGSGKSHFLKVLSYLLRNGTLEEENNQLLIEGFNLQDELTLVVDRNEVSINRPKVN